MTHETNCFYKLSQGSVELRMSYHGFLAQMLLAFKEITWGGLLKVNSTSDVKIICSPGTELTTYPYFL